MPLAMPPAIASEGLLLAAFPPELAGLDAAPPPGWRTALTGVGAVTAAAATARLLAEARPAARATPHGARRR